ncbi:hypothetical protein KIPB_014582, partial [Kipferlia bialata]|eukprot:g14582.t1
MFHRFCDPLPESGVALL